MNELAAKLNRLASLIQPDGWREPLRHAATLLIEQEKTMAREAKVIAALKAETADLKKHLDDLLSAGHVKDDADVAAEAAEATRLGLDANGDPIPAPAPAATT